MQRILALLTPALEYTEAVRLELAEAWLRLEHVVGEVRHVVVELAGVVVSSQSFLMFGYVRSANCL